MPTTGFVVQDHTSALHYSGDTYSTDELWQVARKNTKLATAFVECSYPDSMADLARLSKHLTPALLKDELIELNRPHICVFAYHLQPAYKDQVRSELTALELLNLKVIEEGEILMI